MKHVKTFESFLNEAMSSKYKTVNVEYNDVSPGDYIADGPTVGEVSLVIRSSRQGLLLKRVWNNVKKKNGEEFFIPIDHDAIKDFPKSFIKVTNFS